MWQLRSCEFFDHKEHNPPPEEIECTVDVGEHPFVTLSSYVPFKRAKIHKAEQVKNVMEGDNQTVYGRLSLELHCKIINSLLSSRYPPKKVKDFFAYFGEKPHQIIKRCCVFPD